MIFAIILLCFIGLAVAITTAAITTVALLLWSVAVAMGAPVLHFWPCFWIILALEAAATLWYRNTRRLT